MEKLTFSTRQNNIDKEYYQTETDLRYNTYTCKSSNAGGGGNLPDLFADVANYLLGTYLFNNTKYLKQTTGKPLIACLYYFLHYGNKPYFISNNDPRINNPNVRCTKLIKITQKNLIDLYVSGYFEQPEKQEKTFIDANGVKTVYYTEETSEEKTILFKDTYKDNELISIEILGFVFDLNVPIDEMIQDYQGVKIDFTQIKSGVKNG